MSCSQAAQRHERVIFLSLEWPRMGRHAGGVGRYVARLADALSRERPIAVVAFADADMSLAPTVRLIPIRPPASQFDRYYKSPFVAARLLLGEQAEVIHAHGDDWPLILLGARRRVLRTYYGSSLAEAVSGGRFLRRVNHLLLYVTEFVSRCAVRHRVAIGPDSQQSFSCPVVIPPVVPETVAEPLPHDRRKQQLVFVGSHSGRKRGWLAEDAWRSLRLDRPELELHVVGPADDAINFGPGVVHHAGLSDLEVRELLGSSLALIVPSTYEGFGIPAWEAMLRGTPVVATPNPGSTWQAGDGTGMVISGEGELVTTLASVIDDPAAWRMRSRGAVVDAERTSRSAHPSRYLSLYATVCG